MQLTELIELAEAEAIWGYVHAAPRDVAESLGTAGRRIGGGVVLSVRNDVTSYWNKALGFGFTEPVTGKLVSEITGFYREQGAHQATLQLAPSVLPPDWDTIAEEERLIPGGSWLKLARLAGPAEPAATDLRVASIEPGDVEEWASVMLRGFGMPVELLAPMIEGVTARPGWTQYGAWHEERMVAAAALVMQRHVAEFAGASTLPEWRGQGAQSALLAARSAQAAAAGVNWLSAETGKPAKGQQNTSLNNLLRAGFEIRYERQNWIWRP
jgi:GNAT superfamily N-acetyltransferase